MSDGLRPQERAALVASARAALSVLSDPKAEPVERRVASSVLQQRARLLGLPSATRRQRESK